MSSSSSSTSSGSSDNQEDEIINGWMSIESGSSLDDDDFVDNDDVDPDYVHNLMTQILGVEYWNAETGGSVDNELTKQDAVAHGDIFCHECGSSPIVGTRYKSTQQINYDICRECLQENHDDNATNFVAFQSQVDEDEAREAAGFEMDGIDERSLTYHDVIELASCPFLRNNPNAPVDDITLYLLDSHPDTTLEDVRMAGFILANHATLKEIEIVVWGLKSEMKDIAIEVVRGLQANTSVRSVVWKIMTANDEICQALRDLMTINTTIHFMFFLVPYPFKDNLEDYLFDRLKSTRLHTFRLDSSKGVTDENKKKAWLAMKENPHLKRIKATFENEDYMLQLLSMDKKNKWTNDWLQLNDEDCWDILEKALKECHLFDPPVDPVCVIYHFLRSRPEVAR